MPSRYRLIGGDRREYGPATADEIRSWILAGRADGESRVWEDSLGQWTRLATVSDLALLLPPTPPAGRPVPGGPQPLTLPTESELQSRDYHLRTLDCLGDGWQLFTRQFGALLAGSAMMTGVLLGLALLGLIPYLGVLTVPMTLIVAGPLMGGLWHTGVRAWRGHQVRATDLFDGFRGPFVSLLLVRVATTTLIALAVLPGCALTLFGAKLQAQAAEPSAPALGLLLAGLFLIIGPALLLSTLWAYALELVMDRGIGFWAAMQLSRRVVSRHRIRNLLLLVATRILVSLGALLCLIGAFVTIPWVFAAYARAYEELFGPRHADTAPAP